MAQLTLPGLNDSTPVTAALLEEWVRLILEVLNGGIDDTNLDTAFSIDVTKVRDAVSRRGDTMTGPLEFDDSNGDVDVNGVDLSKLSDEVDLIKELVFDWRVASGIISYSASYTDGELDEQPVPSEVEIAVPEGFNPNSVIVFGSKQEEGWTATDGTMNSSDIVGPLHDIYSDIIRARVKASATWSSVSATQTHNFTYIVFAMFYRQGLPDV